MQVLVVLIARHSRALKIFQQEGMHLLDKKRMPQAIADRITFLPRTFIPQHAKGLSFEKFIALGGAYEEVPDAPKVDGVVVLCEESLSYLLDDVRNAVFAAQVPTITYLENVQNFLIGNFSILLGNYGVLLELVQDATRYQAASLPIRNFDAPELRTLAQVCSTKSLDRTFQNDIIPSFNLILKLRGPKRRSNYPHIYFQDARGRYFRYGHEHHSRYETGGAHNPACLINGSFRFGNGLDQQRHFNVTIGDSDARERISSQFPNCHDELVDVKDRTHINMFSNDFHK
jgi:hypothetical protein